MHKKLSRDFYLSQDTLAIAKALLGKFLVTKLQPNVITSGMIVDVEVYQGIDDKASHAYGNRCTNRTKTMYMKGGHAYVYLCYGMHHIFNAVTAHENVPNAVMFRAIEPCAGIQLMLKRRKLKEPIPKFTSGPGTLTKALGITVKHDKIDLCGNKVWIEDRSIKINPKDIEAVPRVGVAYAKEHAKLPWRFKIKNNLWVSAAN